MSKQNGDGLAIAFEVPAEVYRWLVRRALESKKTLPEVVMEIVKTESDRENN